MNAKKIISFLVICALLVMPLSMNVLAAIPFDNMIAMYNMEGALENKVTGGVGKLWNGASFTSDRGGSVLYLNNDDVTQPGQEGGYDTVGQWAELADSYIPDGDNMTISIWFNVKEHRSWARAIDIGDSRAQQGLGNPELFMNISPTQGTSTVATINANGQSIAPGDRDRAFAPLVDEGVWIHAVYVINANSGKPNTLYINGAPYLSSNENDPGNINDITAEASISPKDVFNSADGLRNVFLGRSSYEENTDQIMNGYIDDVAIFNVALTEDQVKELMAYDFTNYGAAAAEPEPVLEPAAADEPAAPAPAQAAPTPAPRTADPISIIVLGSLISAAGVVIAKKRK